MKDKKMVIVTLVLGIVLIIGLLTASSYALFYSESNFTNNEAYTTGILDIELVDEEGYNTSITLSNSLPMSDDEGKQTTPFKLKLRNNGNLAYTFDLKLVNNTTENSIDTNYLKIMVDSDNPVSYSSLTDGTIKSDITLNPSEEVVIDIRLWLDITTPNTQIGKNFVGKLTVDGVGSEYVAPEGVIATEAISNIYTNASKTTVTNNSVEYQYATSVGMMEDVGGNIRYYGADPNNYVTFNNELWRIIGVFQNIDDGTGKKETRIKIARSESIGNYAWDSNNVNEWPTATLNTYLNGTYFTILTSEAQNMIGDALWNLGGSSTYQGLYANDYYTFERGTQVYSGRSTTWTGKIALMYPSDYMYAGDLSKCSLDGYNWKDDQTNCRDTSWLRNTISSQRTITPDASNSRYVFSVNLTGYVYSSSVNGTIASRPVLFLKSNVQITGGDGSSTNAFTLGQ